MPPTERRKRPRARSTASLSVSQSGAMILTRHVHTERPVDRDANHLAQTFSILVGLDLPSDPLAFIRRLVPGDHIESYKTNLFSSSVPLVEQFSPPAEEHASPSFFKEKSHGSNAESTCDDLDVEHPPP